MESLLQTINSPFRYPGGKFHARALICEIIPEHEFYAEPFAGGASIFFAKPKAPKNILNDLDTGLINCYRHIRDNAEDIIRLLDGIKATKENHRYFKTEYKPSDTLEEAFRWFYLNRTSYSGIMNQPNCYWGYRDNNSMRPSNWPTHLRNCSTKLQDVFLSVQDFEKVIDEAPDDSFLFVDPPYLNAKKGLYSCKMSTADHVRLSKTLLRNSSRLRFLLTYDNCPEVMNLYCWVKNILPQEWNYTVGRTDNQKDKTKNKGKRVKGQELFILNYDPSSPECKPSYLMEPTNAERKQSVTKRSFSPAYTS